MFDFDVTSTLVLSIFMFIIGIILKSKLRFLDKFCIPSPVIGGLLFCIINFILSKFSIVKISMDTSLMSFFMSFFFTILGLGVSLDLIRKGGVLLLKYWMLCGFLAYFQNIITYICSKILDIHPLLSLMCGTISMEGGHGYAAAFGNTIENLGISNASSVGITSATLGLILGGLIGAPFARLLINKYNLKSSDKHFLYSNTSNLSKDNNKFLNLDVYSFLIHILLILVCMNIGDTITNIIFKVFNLKIPTIVCSMFIAVIFRNINDKKNMLIINTRLLNFLTELSLGLFLTMALMNIDLYKLSDYIPYIVFIVFTQVIFILFYCYFVCFRVLGKNFDAAIMISGMIGHALGATPNALANMTSISDKYGYSQKAMLIVPLVGAFLLDIFTMPSIILFINLLS